MRKLVFNLFTFSLLASTAVAQDYTLSENVSSFDDINLHFITNLSGDNKLLTLKNNIESSMYFNPLSNGKVTLDGSDKKYTIDGKGKFGFQTFSYGDLSFKNLTLSNFSSMEKGGAISNNNLVSAIDNTDFVNNSVTSNSEAKGGAIYNAGTIGSVSGNFINNQAFSNGSAYGGAIYHSADTSKVPTIGKISGNFSGNRAVSGMNANGGALYINSENVNVSGSFSDNAAISSNGGAFGGAIIAHQKMIIDNSSFLNNFAQSKGIDTFARGGAVFTTSDLTILADGFNSEFTNNYILNPDGSKTYNALYMNMGNILNLETSHEGTITFNDTIEGNANNKFTMNILGDSSGELSFNAAVKNAETINVANTILNLGSFRHDDGTVTTADLSGAKLNLSNSTLNLENGNMQTIHLDSFTSTADVKLRADANLMDGSSDKIAANSVAEGSQITLEKLNIVEDGTSDITLFANGKAPEIMNLDSFAAFSQNNKYTFNSNGDGILQVASFENRGLNGVISDDTLTKSYTVGDGTNVSDHLGELAGGAGATLSILGNNNVLDGNGYNGIKIADGQTLNIDDTEVRNFASTLGGVVSSSGKVVVTNSSFIGNHGNKAGAIYATNDVVINADGKVSLFSNNSSSQNTFSEKSGIDNNSNAVYLDNPDAALKLNAFNHGKIIFNDRIDGAEGYNLEINGDENSSVLFNNRVAHAGEIIINSGEVRLGEDHLMDGASMKLNGGMLNLSNEIIGTAHFQDFNNNNGFISLDVDPLNLAADKLAIDGDLTGNSRLLINALNEAKPDMDILFAETHNDNPDTDGSFEVWRVNGSPFAWETKYDPVDKDWYMSLKETSDTSDILVVPEVISYLGLNNAAFEQTRSVMTSLRNKANSQTVYTNCCGFYDRNYNGEPLINLWASPVYMSANLDSPVDFEQDLFGLEAGGDVMIDANSRLGLFGSYRQGKYDFSGKANNLRAEKSSKIDIDSYLLGIYYEYSRGNFHGLASLFGGVQKANLQSSDSIHNSTDGKQFGGSVEMGYAYSLNSKLTVEPSVAITRSFIEFDSIRDDAGKYASFDSAEHFEMEAALKLEQKIELGSGEIKAYLRPSILRVIHRNGDVNVSSLGKLNGLENAYYGRIEGGISAAVRENLDLYCNVAYTFNRDYRQESVSAGINYAF